jgi:predicted permease
MGPAGWLSFVRHLLRGVLGRARQDRELSDELHGYLQQLTDEYAAAGLSRADAEQAARRDLGSLSHVTEQVRDVRPGAWIGELLRDVRFAVRAMARRPGFTCLAVMTIGIGIGATAAIFSVADGVLFRPLPFPRADRLVAVWEARPDIDRPRLEASPLNYVDWADQAESFETLAAYFHDSMNLTRGGTPERLPVAGVTPNFLSMLGVRPLLGRWFEAPDGAPGQASVTVLSYGLWQRRFGADPAVVGRTIRLRDELHTVIGVMPRGFQFPHPRVQAWVPVDYVSGNGLRSRTLYVLYVVGRLKPDVPVAMATSELRAIAAALALEYPTNGDSSAFAVPLQDDLARDGRASFLLLLGAAGLVLLIACANVAGLLLTRGSSRDAEFALRTALGASRARLARQLLVEGLLLAGAGALVGLLLASRTFGILDTLVPESLQGTVTATLDVRLLAFGAGAALLTGVLFCLVPLRHAFQRDLRTALAARVMPRAVGRRLETLVTAEVTLGVVVLFCTGLMLQTILNLEAAEIGFEKRGVLTARVELSQGDYPTPRHQLDFQQDLLERLAALPGVVSAGMTTMLPYSGAAVGSAPIRVEGRQDLLDLSRSVYLRAITPGYLPTLQVPVREGRNFSDRDTAATELAAIVSAEVNAALGGDLVGQRVAFGLGGGEWIRVVGVAGDVRFDGVDVADSRGALYVPAAQLPQIGPGLGFFMPRDVAVRTTNDPVTLAAALREAVWEINANQSVADLRTLDELVDGQIAGRKVQAALISTFAGLGLFMASLGVYGLLSFTVAVRARELGVRSALGASASDLVKLVSKSSLLRLGAGLAVGLVLALAAGRAMRSMIYGVEPLDWLSLAASITILGAAGCAAALLPVRRATRIDPVVVLRAE